MSRPALPRNHDWRVWLRRVAVLSLKEVRQFSRDTALVIFMIYAFIGAVYLAGSTVSMQLRSAAIVVRDLDRTPESRDLIYHFREPYFRFDGLVSSGAEGSERLDLGRSMMLVNVPPGFQRSLSDATPTSVQVLIDTSNATLGFLASSYAQQIAAQYSLDLALRRLRSVPSAEQRLPTVTQQTRVWFNPNSDDKRFHGLGEIAEMITLFAMLLPAAAMAREKERGTIEQLLVAPLTPIQIMLSKVVPMVAIIVAATFLSMSLIIEGAFGVPIRGSAALFYTMTAIYAFSASGVGLVIASLTRNMAQVGLMSILVLGPMFLLSGSFAPSEGMNPLIRPIAYASPLYYYMRIIFAVVLKGNGLETLWPSALSMTGVGLALFSFGAWRFRAQFGR